MVDKVAEVPLLPKEYLLRSGRVKKITFPSAQRLQVQGVAIKTWYQHQSPRMNDIERDFVENIVEAIHAPIIQDTFSNQGERRAWREQLAKENPQAFGLYNTNLLRRNVLTKITDAYDVLEDKSGLSDLSLESTYRDLLEVIRNKTDAKDGASVYTQLPFYEKVAFAERVRDFGIAICATYVKQSAAKVTA